jgi:fatty-acyl-CoA synthase
MDNMNIGLAVHRNAVRNPDSEALFGADPLTYEELDRKSNRIAHYLLSFGFEKGDRVAVLLPNRSEVIELITGISKAALVYVGLNFRLGVSELEQIFDNCDPVLVITDSEHLKQISELPNIGNTPVHNVETEEWNSTLGLSSDELPVVLDTITPDDDFCIVYTSGTTGRPKGVLFDHKRVLQHATVACIEYELERKSRYLIQIPHNSSVNITIIPCLTVGAAISFRDSRNFNPLEFANQVERDNVTHSFLVPTQLMRLLEKLPDSSNGKLKSLTTLGYGSSPISPQRLKELVSRFGSIFNQLYGMAEIASIGTILRKEDHVLGLTSNPKLLASCGQPSLAVNVRVVDEDGKPVEDGERGEVIFSGPHVMKGYFRDIERTEEVLINGWMHSGDIAEVDPKGFIYIVDRKKNLIIRGGLNIAPTEIENVIYRHEAVLEVSVVGVPDPEWGEGIVAVLALKEGFDVGVEEIKEFCADSELTSIKVPERIEIWEDLPKNAVGKIAKNEIRSVFWGSGRQI